MQRYLSCAGPECGSNTVALGYLYDSGDKLCFSAELNNSDVAAHCCISVSFGTELVCLYGHVLCQEMSWHYLVPAECCWILH